MFYSVVNFSQESNPGKTETGGSPYRKTPSMNLISVRQAHERMNISPRLISQMMADGRLTKYKLDGGQLVRIDLDELQALFIPQK